MSEVKRYHVTEAGLVEGVALGRITVVLVADFDRVKAERDALQDRLTEVEDMDSDLIAIVAELQQRNDALSIAYLRAGEREHELRLRVHQLGNLLSRWADLLGVSAPGLRDETLAVLKQAEAQQCQFPQSCTTRCDCDIPDFSPGNGNKARRRAAALKTSALSDANEPPCTACFARGCNGECMENL